MTISEHFLSDLFSRLHIHEMLAGGRMSAREVLDGTINKPHPNLDAFRDSLELPKYPLEIVKLLHECKFISDFDVALIDFDGEYGSLDQALSDLADYHKAKGSIHHARTDDEKTLLDFTYQMFLVVTRGLFPAIDIMQTHEFIAEWWNSDQMGTQPLSDVLRKTEKFDDFYLAIIRNAENDTELDLAFKTLFDYYNQREILPK
jgi:type II secretory pathway component PulF